MGFLQWLAATPVAAWVLASETYGYYIMLSVHAVGMAIVAGIIFMLCARLLGFAKDAPLGVFDRPFTLAKWGFLFNALSGAALFAANGPNLVKNTPFLLKLTFIAIGGLTLLLMTRAAQKERVAIDGGASASVQVRGLAAVTAALWVAAILSGRIIAYTITY